MNHHETAITPLYSPFFWSFHGSFFPQPFPRRVRCSWRNCKVWSSRSNSWRRRRRRCQRRWLAWGISKQGRCLRYFFRVSLSKSFQVKMAICGDFRAIWWDKSGFNRGNMLDFTITNRDFTMKHGNFSPYSNLKHRDYVMMGIDPGFVDYSSISYPTSVSDMISLDVTQFFWNNQRYS